MKSFSRMRLPLWVAALIGWGPAASAESSAAAFQTIQNEVFTRVCVGCHAGAAAPLGLRLNEGFSYDSLVGVRSTLMPSLLRIKPGDPDASFLMQKVEGKAATGARMPLGGPALSAEQLSAIRQWIADGARPPASSQAQPQPTPASVTAGSGNTP